MKKSMLIGLITIFIIFSFLLFIALKKGSFSWIASINAPVINTKVYQLEANGFNGRLYEFRKDKNICYSVAYDSGAGGLWCYKDLNGRGIK